ncbi:hypothetical protein SCHPADRAFT_383803 [Schizopora paradoxa]|uniref:CoA-dependent acyltransferase n=1 Tax=Schizopora paradoxa TaxID=27342 RepID=A0A0H2RMM0_9AGAM|nr:hypothetical protein SCHPADRAFT_383803 [Schizopora paradoxa]
MPHPIQDEPSWKETSLSTTDGVKTYSRPLLGIEIGEEVFTRKGDGFLEVCLGFTFNTSLSAKNLISRMRDSLVMARFQMPSIASTIVSDHNDEDIRLWEYTALRKGDMEKLTSWIDESLTVRRGPIDIEAFISEMTQRRTPYVHADGREQHIHFYLLIDDSDAATIGKLRAALFLHGGHILLDAYPSLKCLNSLFGWIANPPVLGEIDWGTEWERLPAGPLTATGGPRDDFDTKGMELLQRAGAIMSDPLQSLSISAPRTTVRHPGKLIRSHKSFDEQTSSNILQACEEAGFTMQHIIDAALFLLVIESNEAKGTKSIENPNVHITLSHNAIPQENYLVPPHKSPSHFISGLVTLPIRVMYSSVPPPTTSKKERLLSLMSEIKPQYDEYLANKNAPHIFSALFALEGPPRELPVNTESNFTTVSNIGNLNNFVECSRTSENGGPGVSIEIERFDLAGRLLGLHVALQAWLLNGYLHMMIQTTDAWNDDDVERYLEEFSENILLIANSK